MEYCSDIKEVNTVTCDNMEKTGEHAKWNYPNTERQILYELTRVESKKSNRNRK